MPATSDQVLTELGAGELLRIVTAGSVDDGKSTLIGRLLYDSKSILADQLAHIESVSMRRGDDGVDLALLTDGLRAEREQGITIDVAYRYFATPRRKFIVADSPGHVQYTRNMVTGASTANLALVLVNARDGLTEQSRRHLFLASLLGIRHLVVAVNKMDLVDWSQGRFEELHAELAGFAARLGSTTLGCVPVSALTGDNVVEASSAMPWYAGPPLLRVLEQVPLANDHNLADVRLPVQWVIRPRPSAETPRRAYAGQMAGGVLTPGDAVQVLPGGGTSQVIAIEGSNGLLDEAFPPMSVAVRLADELDVSRGDLLCRPDDRPVVGTDLEGVLCWMATTPLRPGAVFTLKHTTRRTRAVVTAVDHRLDVTTLERETGVDGLALNDVGGVRLRTTSPACYDDYYTNRATGSFILMDETTNETAGAGMLRLHGQDSGSGA